MQSIIKQNGFMLSVLMISFVMLNVALLSVVMLSVVMQLVVIISTIMCLYAECPDAKFHSSERHCTVCRSLYYLSLQ